MNSLLSAKEAIQLLNQWGKDKTPFLFFTNYNAELWWAKKLSDISPSEILYNIPLGSNHEERELPNLAIHWEANKNSFDAYAQAFAQIQKGLQRGDSFLTNLTWATPIETNLTEEALYTIGKAPFRLWVKGKFCVFSPEPFVQIDRNIISTFPMKGTAEGIDEASVQSLLQNPKEQAEHATIVDLLRNDLSIVAKEVKVARYRYVEPIETIRGTIAQTSSEISGIIREDYQYRWGDLLHALLPAGSVTGAPKRRTLEMIEQAEPTSRGWYTGVFGLCNGEQLQSAVMIRFIEFTPSGEWLFHSGGGITAQSDLQQEFDEMILKTYAPIYRKHPD